MVDPLTASTDLHSVDEFENLVVKQTGASITPAQGRRDGRARLVELRSQRAFGGVRSVFVGIKVAPDANILNVAE